MEKFAIMCMSKAAFQDVFRFVIGIMQVFSAKTTGIYGRMLLKDVTT